MTTIKPQVDVYTVPVRAAAPQAFGIARMLGALFGRGINGNVGTIRYGSMDIGTRSNFTGYADPPQLFTGYDPRKVAAGTFRGQPQGLPNTAAPPSPMNDALMRSMATVTNAQLGV
jgi:hypothetical protein